MRRYRLVGRTGDGLTPETAFRPNLPAGTHHGVMAELGSRFLVWCAVPDATAETADTICDLDTDGTVKATALSVAERTAIKTWLTGQGIDVSTFDSDGVTNRRLYARWLVRRVLNRLDLDGPDLLRPAQVQEG